MKNLGFLNSTARTGTKFDECLDWTVGRGVCEAFWHCQPHLSICHSCVRLRQFSKLRYLSLSLFDAASINCVENKTYVTNDASSISIHFIAVVYLLKNTKRNFEQTTTLIRRSQQIIDVENRAIGGTLFSTHSIGRQNIKNSARCKCSPRGPPYDILPPSFRI